MKIKIISFFILLALVACTPIKEATDTENTAIAIAQTKITLTQIASPTETQTPLANMVLVMATPFPTQPPPPIFTPDKVQVERWEEYQSELRKAVLYHSGDMANYAICEWDILGRSGLEVYVWAVCTGDRMPAVVHLNADGSVQKVEVPNRGSTWDSDIQRMFPADVQEKFSLYTGNSMFYGREREMIDHLNYRETHWWVPPLIVLDKVPTATPKPVVPVLTPDAIQVAKWKEYQAELAKVLMCDAGYECPNYENAICEWDILERYDQGLYVWAICRGGKRRGPVVIHLDSHGSILKTEVPINEVPWESRLFPPDVRTKIFLYGISERCSEIVKHLNYRQFHPEEPPLIVLAATLTATPTP